MGWLLTVVLAMPLAQSDVEFQMWFSKQRYCNFALEKFGEKPFVERRFDGTAEHGEIRHAECRKLDKTEEALVPKHLLWKVK